MLYQQNFFIFSFKNLILEGFHIFVQNTFLEEGLGFSEHKELAGTMNTRRKSEFSLGIWDQTTNIGICEEISWIRQLNLQSLGHVLFYPGCPTNQGHYLP